MTSYEIGYLVQKLVGRFKTRWIHLQMLRPITSEEEEEEEEACYSSY
jgi:hypothetical protein